VIGWDVAQTGIPAVDFVHKYEHVFAFKSVVLHMFYQTSITISREQSIIPRTFRLRCGKVQLCGLYEEVCYIPASRTSSVAQYINYS